MSSGCQAQSQVLHVVNSSQLYILNSSFRDASARGLSITSSNSELDGNVFENLGYPNLSFGGGALYVDNSDGS